VLKYTHQFLFIIQRDALLMYHKFDYKLQELTLIAFCLEEKNRQISET